MAFPASACFDNPLSGNIQVSNDSDCTAEFRTRFQADDGTQQSTDSVKVDSGGDAEFGLSLGSMPNRPLTLDQTVEVKVGNIWKEVDSNSVEIEPQFSDFQILSSSYPSFVQPDTPVTSNITVQNTGDCVGTASLSGTMFQGEQFTIEPGQTQKIQHQVSMPGGAQPVSLQLNNDKRGIQADSFSTKMEPSETVLIDKEKGQLEMVGGFSVKLRYAGILQGENIEGQSVEESDNFIGGGQLASFSGQVSTTPGDKDVISFDSVKFLNMRFGDNIQWVMDSEILGKAQSYEYNEYPASMANRMIPRVADEPEITVNPSPTDRLDKIRNKLGISARVFSPSTLRRVQRS